VPDTRARDPAGQAGATSAPARRGQPGQHPNRSASSPGAMRCHRRLHGGSGQQHCPASFRFPAVRVPPWKATTRGQESARAWALPARVPSCRREAGCRQAACLSAAPSRSSAGGRRWRRPPDLPGRRPRPLGSSRPGARRLWQARPVRIDACRCAPAAGAGLAP